MKHCTVLSIKNQRLCMLEVSKVVFVAFTQHCTQSNVAHVGGVEGVYTIASHPCQEGRLFEPSVLWV